LLNILTPELANKADDFIVSCQTYEGGMGAYPGNEAHGGYTFCALAALVILGKTNRINFDNLVVLSFLSLLIISALGCVQTDAF
jgi:protein farnesyltransferase subunit beta